MGGIVSGVGSIVGGFMGADASKHAADQQARLQQQAIDFQKGVYNNTEQNFRPWIGAGQNAVQALAGFYGLPGGAPTGQAAFQQFQQTPFYQFPLQQSMLALNRQLAASGLSGSGAALRDGTKLASGYASQGLGQYLGGLTGLSGLGQSSTSALGGYGNSAAAGIGQGFTNMGNALAAGTVGANNAMNQGIQNGIGSVMGSGSGYGSGIGGALNNVWNTASGWFTPSAFSSGDPSTYGATGNGMNISSAFGQAQQPYGVGGASGMGIGGV